MLNTIPAIPQTRAERLRWGILDSWTLARRSLTYWLRSPQEIIGGLLFPVVSVLLFGYVFGSAMVVPGGGDYRQFLMPGLFGMTMVFGIVITASAVVADIHRGVTDRFRSTPMAQSAWVVGRSAADMLRAMLDLGVLIGTALLVGWRPHGTFGETAAALALLLLLRLALVWGGIVLGLVLRTTESISAVWPLILPFAMVANTFVAPELMPRWIGTLAEWNPMSATVDATRELFHSPGLGGDSWIADHGMLMSVAWPLALLAVFLPLAVWRFRRLSHTQ